MIKIEYVKPLEPLLKKLKHLASSNKGELSGNGEKGTFNVKSPIGTFQGTYSYIDKNIYIDIKKKPLLISTRLIEEEIKKYLSNN